MNKKTYECLEYMTDELYKKLNTTSVAICNLKQSVLNISEILKREYENKYKKSDKNL